MTDYSVRQDGIGENLGMLWQAEEIERLATILKNQGVKDVAVREEILGEFFFHLATRLDGSAMGIEHKGKEYRPRLVFESAVEPRVLILRDGYDLHDYTFGDIADVLRR